MPKIKTFESFSVMGEPMISRGKLSIYEINSWDALVDLYEDNVELFQTCAWSISPKFKNRQGWDPKKFFETYMRQYPNFFVVIDGDAGRFFGLSVKNENDFIAYWENDLPVDRNVVIDYLNRLRIKMKDLLV